jgi:prepilin peptidase CpaA
MLLLCRSSDVEPIEIADWPFISVALGHGYLAAQAENTTMDMIVLIVGIGIFISVAYGDFRTRRIPNEFIVGILALAAVRMALTATPASALFTLLAAAALFVGTFLLFWRGLLGGGDVKLIGATALLVGYHELFEFLFVMSVSGALIAVAILAQDRLVRRRATAPATEDQDTPARLTVPYGVAIAAAGIVSLLAQTVRPG